MVCWPSGVAFSFLWPVGGFQATNQAFRRIVPFLYKVAVDITRRPTLPRGEYTTVLHEHDVTASAWLAET